jgi:hypothetical protein
MLKKVWVWLTLFLFGCTAAAGSGVTATPEPRPVATPGAGSGADGTPEPRIEVPADVPAVDVTKHSVPLDQIYFDTFQPVNRAVPLSQASPELIEELRDAIPPIHDPQYEAAAEANWLRAEDQVLGYVAGDQAWAFPVRILNFHEIVNDVLAGEPVLISYCPLCASGIVFSRQLGERTLTFGNTSALYESDMVMLDYGTGSYWWQVAGEAIVGPLTGERLTVLPSAVTTWGQWQALHPQTLVLARPAGRPARTYDRDPFVGFEDALNSGRFAFPVSEAGRDERLVAGARVLAITSGGDVRGYPLTGSEPQAISDTVGEQAVVVFTDPQGPTGAAFEPLASGRALGFAVRDGEFVDRETGSVWNLAGEAVSGQLSGAQLPAVPSRTTFWFAIVAAEPEITLFRE